VGKLISIAKQTPVIPTAAYLKITLATKLADKKFIAENKKGEKNK